MASPTDDIKGAMKDLLGELKENRRALDAQLDAINRRMEAFTERMEILRREILGLCITRAEYDPKHQILLDKMVRYDRIIDESQKAQAEYADFKARVKQNQLDIKEAKLRAETNPGRLMQYIAIIIAVLGFLLQLFQHLKLS